MVQRLQHQSYLQLVWHSPPTTSLLTSLAVSVWTVTPHLRCTKTTPSTQPSSCSLFHWSYSVLLVSGWTRFFPKPTVLAWGTSSASPPPTGLAAASAVLARTRTTSISSDKKTSQPKLSLMMVTCLKIMTILNVIKCLVTYTNLSLMKSLS